MGEVLWGGITCLFSAFYFLAPTLFTSENSLIERTGQVEEVSAFYTEVSSRGNKSLKSQLVLKLQDDNRSYKLAKNIGKNLKNENFERIEQELKKSGNAIVWIKKSERLDLEPEVFQIATGEKEMLHNLEDTKYELKWLFPFLIIMGLLMIGIYYHHKYPEHFKSF